MSYPAGADNPRAPWNITEPEECPECEGTGIPNDGVSEDEESCEHCGGEGYIYPPTREEIAETKAEIDADRRLSE